MGSPYVGECRLVGFSFAPVGWSTCQGQLLPISENETLFNLIGTTYGGDGQETFQLPDLQGRVPIHQGTLAGQTFTIGEKAGVESVTLTSQTIPIHNHALLASNTGGNTNLLTAQVLAGATSQIYNASGPSPSLVMNANSLPSQGGSQPHENLQPYLTMNWIISLFGIFPTQN